MCFCQAEIDWISTEPPLSKLMMHILTPTVAPWPSWEIDAVIMCFMRFLIKSFTASLAHHNILRALKGPRHDLRSDVPFIRSEMIFSKSLIEGQLDPFDRCSFDLSCWDNCDLLGDAQAKLFPSLFWLHGERLIGYVMSLTVNVLIAKLPTYAIETVWRQWTNAH